MPGGCLQDAPPFVVEWLPTIGDVPEVDSAKAELPQWAGPDLFGGLQGTLMRAPPPKLNSGTDFLFVPPLGISG